MTYSDFKKQAVLGTYVTDKAIDAAYNVAKDSGEPIYMGDTYANSSTDPYHATARKAGWKSGLATELGVGGLFGLGTGAATYGALGIVPALRRKKALRLILSSLVGVPVGVATGLVAGPIGYGAGYGTHYKPLLDKMKEEMAT